MPVKTRLSPHPVSLIFASLVLIGVLIFIKRPIPLIYLIFLFLLCVKRMGLRISDISLKIWKLWPWLVVTFVLHALLSSHNAVSFSFLPTIGFNGQGLLTALFFVIRLTAILAVGMALSLLFPPQDYARQTARAVGKLPFWTASVSKLELTIGLALQFVPFLEQENRRLELALAARGVVTRGSLAQRFAAKRAILLPLMLNAFRRADQVSLALEARGYDPRIVPTSLHESRIPAKEMLAVGLFTVVVLVALWL